jgi:hypothetical protein
MHASLLQAKSNAHIKEPELQTVAWTSVRNVSGSRRTGMAGRSDSSRFHALLSQIASNLFQLVLAIIGVTPTVYIGVTVALLLLCRIFKKLISHWRLPLPWLKGSSGWEMRARGFSSSSFAGSSADVH